MNHAKQYVIAVDIQTTSPMHITAIEKGAYDPATQKLARYDGNGVGCSLTRTQSLAHSARVLDNGVVVTPLVPVIPASTVAGKLRRAAADLIANSLVQRQLQISPDAYNVLTSGMSNTELKADEKTPEVLRMARKDAFLSLFGGTSFAMSAHSVIAEGWPIIGSTLSCLMTPPIGDVQPFAGLSEMTEVPPIVRKNDVADMQGKHLQDVVGFDNLVAYAQAEGVNRSESKAKKAAKEDGKKTDLRTLNAVEAVKTGVAFALRVEVTAFDAAQLGLMLLAMQELLREGQVGGKAARGFGRFIATGSRLYEVDPNTRIKTVISTLFEGKETGYAFADNDVVNTSVMAAQDYVDAISPQLLEAFTQADAKTLKKMYKEAA